MCWKCVDQGIRAFADIGADSRPVPDKREMAMLAFEVADQLGRVADNPIIQLELLFKHGRVSRAFGTFDRDASVAALLDFTPEYWRDSQLVGEAADALLDVSGSPGSDRAIETALMLCREASLHREIFRRIARGLPPMPDVEGYTSNYGARH